MIDYARLGRSVEHYEKVGYTHVEVPWTVTQAVSNITKPPGAGEYLINSKNKVLVASGEQGFLYLALKGFLPPGKFQAITPCFRDEPFDVSHTKYFMKNELIITDDPSIEMVKKIIGDALEYFHTEHPTGVLRVVETAVGCDIELNGIELGSYGLRKTSFLTWVYGTGLAEPRFTMAKNAA
jgi:hypothetical protein